MNLRIERMNDISFTVHTNVIDQRKEKNKWLISLFGKSKMQNYAQVKKGVFKGKTRFARTRRNIK